MKKTLIRRLAALFLAFSMIVVYPLSASAYGLDDYLEDSFSNKLELLEYLEEKTVDGIKDYIDWYYDNAITPQDWLELFKSTDPDTFTNSGPSTYNPGDSGGGSGGCYFMQLTSGGKTWWGDHSFEPNCAFSLMNNYMYSSTPHDSRTIIFATPRRSDGYLYFTYLVFSDAPSDLTFYWGDVYPYGVLKHALLFDGSFSGSITAVNMSQDEWAAHNRDHPYRFSRDSIKSYSKSNYSMEQLVLYADSEIVYSDFPILSYSDGSVVDPGSSNNVSWAHSFNLHSNSSGTHVVKSSGSVLDLFVYYTGDESNFDPDEYTASGGLVYYDSETGNKYFPNADYMFFSSIGAGKIPNMTNPGCIFHMHLDQLKDWIKKKQLGTGGFYAFVGVTDSNNQTVYYAQDPIDFSTVEGGIFGGLTDYPDWDDYKPTVDDDTQTPTLTQPDYDDYTGFQDPPSTFDFEAYAQWIYTNLSIMNGNIGLLNDNLVAFFGSFEDFIDDFYPFFTGKFNFLADVISSNIDALSDYIKDINVTATFNGNVIVDNLKDELEIYFEPDQEDVDFVLLNYLPWFSQLVDAFAPFAGDDIDVSNISAQRSASGEIAKANSIDDGFYINLPTGMKFDTTAGNLIWEEYYIPIEKVKNDDLYLVLTYAVYAAGFFSCIKIGFQILGISFGSIVFRDKDDDDD